MTDKEKRVLNTLEKVLPLLTEHELDGFQNFGEGVYFKAMQDGQHRREPPQEPATA